SRLHGSGDGTLHGPPECDPVLELVGDAAGKKGGVEVGILHLVDVEFDRPSGQVLEAGPEALGLRATATDHDPGTGGVDVNDQTVSSALDVDAGNGTAQQLAGEIVADLPV